MKLKLVRRQPETHDTETFFWQPDHPVDFKPGQYLKWTIRDDHKDDRGDSRWFTIAASPTEPNLRLTTKFHDNGSTFKKTLKLLSIGEEIEGFGPMGSFLLPEDVNQPLVFVAGGIGITPFRAMLKYMVDKNIGTSVHLLYACRSDQDIAFFEELKELAASHPNIKITYILGTPSQTVLSETGQLTAQRILDLTKDDRNPNYYLSGPEPMVEALQQELIKLIPEERVKHDFFPGYTEV